MLCVLLAFAPLPFPRPAEPDAAALDLAALQGRWTEVSRSFGETRWGEDGGSARIAGPRASFSRGGRHRHDWPLVLKPGKDGKRFVAKVLSGDGKGRTIEGDYRLDGDTFVLRWQETVGPGGFGIGEWHNASRQ
jgi:hypothetical protein